MTELKATDASQLTATFDAEVPAETTVEVTKGTSKIDGKAAINGTTVTFDATAKLTAGTYTLTATLGESKASKDVEVKDEYVAEIKLLNDVALTGKAPGSLKDATAAYIYYDVLNQYGHSIRTSENVEWTVAPNNKTIDKATGKITVTKTDGFTYGSTIYVTGVHVKSGQAYSGSVTVGMAQAVDKIEFSGFLSTTDKTKKIDSLPKDFAKNTYYLLYKTFDQNGSPLDVTESEYTSDNLTFICDSPLVLELDTQANKVFTIDGEEYAAVAVQPGQYVDKGGEVNITAISNKTGTKTTKNYVIGTAGLLQSLELSTPATIVADGDSNVKIPYTAKDTEGNIITNYETIVRSTNTLSLSASDDTALVVKEENDGTAGIYWSDAAKYNPTLAATYTNSDVCNDVSRNVSLTTVVVGGESNNMMLQVSDIRRPNAIKEVKLTDDNNDVVISGYSGKLDVTSDITYLDQYGEVLDGKKASAFFANAFVNPFGKSGEAGKYAIRCDVKGTDYLGVEGVTDADVSYAVDPRLTVTEPTAETVKYSIVKSSSTGWVDISKIKSVTYTVLPIASVKNYAISDISRMEITTELSSKANGTAKADVATGSAIVSAIPSNDSVGTFTVTGTYEGKTVTLPTSYYTASVAANKVSAFDIAKKNSDSGEPIKGYVTAVTSGALSWSDLYDYNSYGAPRKDAELNLILTIDKGNDTEEITKTITVSDEAPKVSAVKITLPYNYSTREVTLNPALTLFDGNTLDQNNLDSWVTHSAGKIIGVCSYEWAHTNPTTPVVYVQDQYGKVMSKDIEFTVSDIKESTSELTHKTNNFVVNSNGTTNANIEGAEIGDTFTLTAKVAGEKISDSIKVTVGADTSANIEVGTDNDKALRALLGYDR